MIGIDHELPKFSIVVTDKDSALGIFVCIVNITDQVSKNTISTVAEITKQFSVTADKIFRQVFFQERKPFKRVHQMPGLLTDGRPQSPNLLCFDFGEVSIHLIHII